MVSTFYDFFSICRNNESILVSKGRFFMFVDGILKMDPNNNQGCKFLKSFGLLKFKRFKLAPYKRRKHGSIFVLAITQFHSILKMTNNKM